MTLFVVQRWVEAARWEDVLPVVTPGEHPIAWSAVDAGQAFHRAVVVNEHERLGSESYRVLPFEGGASFNVSINVEGAAHGGSDD